MTQKSYHAKKPRPGEDRKRVREPEMRKLPPHPHWPLNLDLRIFETRGCYRKLSALAAEIDRPVAAVLGRWHIIRGGRA